MRTRLGPDAQRLEAGYGAGARNDRSRTGSAELLDSSIPTAALPSAGSVTIEFPGRALLSIEGAADPAVIRAVLESLAR